MMGKKTEPEVQAAEVTDDGTTDILTAKAMFAERPDLAAVRVRAEDGRVGTLTRDGSFDVLPA